MLQAHVRGRGGRHKTAPWRLRRTIVGLVGGKPEELEAGCGSERGGQIPQCALLILDAGMSSHRKGSSL